MKDWFTVSPDVTKIMNKHFTPGRGGANIEYITRHHLAGILTTEQTWDVWQSRQASAHYVVENSGRIGQLVWDRDTAWSNANSNSNSRSIAIEHSNSGGEAAGWPINETVIREGARLAAALCWFYKLGRPAFGKNIRDHREFGQTSCPYHLASGGKYHNEWMRIAGEHYDWMAAGGKAPESKPQEGISMSEADRIIKHLQDFITGFVGPVGSDVKDVRTQLTGGRNEGEYPGWPQLGKNAQGQDLTLVDAIAALRRDLDTLRKEIKR